MAKEAFRGTKKNLVSFPSILSHSALLVLKKDGIAAFSVWGRPSQSAQIQVIPSAAKQVGITRMGEARGESSTEEESNERGKKKG
jgi:hypothetical protein